MFYGTIIAHLAAIEKPNDHQELIATNQSEFLIEARPTRIGRVRKTRDMGEVMACYCGQEVAEAERVRHSTMAVECTYRGCEPGWVSLYCELQECFLMWVPRSFI